MQNPRGGYYWGKWRFFENCLYWRQCIFGSGAKIIGEIKISSDVQIADNAVVVKDVISDRWCTVGGVPAKIISLNHSHNNLIKATELVGF